MLEPGEVVIVSGPPGSGKTSVADALAADAPLSVHLESDWFFRFIRSGFVAPWLPESHLQNTAVLDVTTDAAAGYARAGYAVVWDGIVGPWFLDRVVGRLADQGVRVRYLVLRPQRETALTRVRGRDGTTDMSGAEKMFDELADLGDLEKNVVDSEGKLDEVVDRCRRALSGAGLRIECDVWTDDFWPVSVKGIIEWNGRFVVLRNRRDEWELPGGRLDSTDAGPVDALRREVLEEIGLNAEVGEFVDSWIYDVNGKRVLILTYRCHVDEPAELAFSDEHVGVAAMTIDQLSSEEIPAGYLRSLRLTT